MEEIIDVNEFLPIIDLITNAERKHEGDNLWLTIYIPFGVELNLDKITCYFNLATAKSTWTNISPIKQEFEGRIKDKNVSDFIANELEKRATRTIIIAE